MDTDQEKKELRLVMKQKKSELSAAERQRQSNRIFAKIEALPVFQDARVVMAYWALPDEVATQEFIEKYATHKTILLPVLYGETLQLKVFQGKDNMEAEARFGIPEPAGKIYTGQVDLVIIPGVAFDKNQRRLGRGKGFYDRFLEEISCFKIGVGFDFQLLETLPVASYDIPMDLVITG